MLLASLLACHASLRAACPVCRPRPTRTDSRAGRTDQGTCCAADHPPVPLPSRPCARQLCTPAMVSCRAAAHTCSTCPAARQSSQHAESICTFTCVLRRLRAGSHRCHCQCSLPTAFLTVPAPHLACSAHLLGSPARLTCSTRLLDSTLLACVLGSPARLVRATPRASCSRLRCLTCSARLCLSHCVCLPHL